MSVNRIFFVEKSQSQMRMPRLCIVINLLFLLLKKLILFATLIPVVPPQMALPLASCARYHNRKTYLPDDQGVVVLATERRQVLFVMRERQRLDQHLMQLHPVNDFKRVEVPDNDVRLQQSGYADSNKPDSNRRGAKPKRKSPQLKRALTWKPMCVFWPLAMYLPELDTMITEMSLSWPRRNRCVRDMMWRTTMVVPSGKMMCSLSGCSTQPLFTLPAEGVRTRRGKPAYLGNL